MISNGILWNKIEIQTRNCQFQVYKNSMSSGCGNHCSIKTFYQLNIEEHAQWYIKNVTLCRLVLVIWNAWASYKCKWYVHLPNIQNITYACLYLFLNANTILIIEKLIKDQICNLLILYCIYLIFIPQRLIIHRFYSWM